MPVAAIPIVPRVGLASFEFGMTRDQAWATTRSSVRSWFAQTWSVERSDEFQEHAIHAHYDAGRVGRLVAFTSNGRYAARCPMNLFEQELGPECDWDDIVALVELQNLEHAKAHERLDVPSLGLSFGFMERGEPAELRLEWISIEAAGRDTPFAAGG